MFFQQFIRHGLSCPATRPLSVFCPNTAAITSLTLCSTCALLNWKAQVWCLWVFFFFLFLPGIYGWAFRLPLRNCARVSLSLFVCCFTILMCWAKSAKWRNVIPGYLNELVQLSHKILFFLEDGMHTYSRCALSGKFWQLQTFYMLCRFK